MRAILPLTAAPFVSTEHPSAGTEATRGCVTSKACGPNCAGAASWLPAMSAGVVTFTRRSGLALKMNICMRGGAPSAGVVMLELSRPLKSCPSA